MTRTCNGCGAKAVPYKPYTNYDSLTERQHETLAEGGDVIIEHKDGWTEHFFTGVPLGHNTFCPKCTKRGGDNCFINLPDLLQWIRENHCRQYTKRKITHCSDLCGDRCNVFSLYKNFETLLKNRIEQLNNIHAEGMIDYVIYQMEIADLSEHEGEEETYQEMNDWNVLFNGEPGYDAGAKNAEYSGRLRIDREHKILNDILKGEQ